MRPLRPAAGRIVGACVCARPALRLAIGLLLFGCEAPGRSNPPLAAQQALPTADFAALIQRVSEPGGYFDTDNLISNETGYLKVRDALERMGLGRGAYIGVGPDQNYSYIAELNPEVAFVTDIRRDNLLHHLLLKALIERSETRIEFLCALVGVAPPSESGPWRERSAADVVAWVDAAWQAEGGADSQARSDLSDEVRAAIERYGLALSDRDHGTIRRFHHTFMDAGLSLRFESFGRPPRPYYPTYRQLTLETDLGGDPASYLASAERYAVVRDLHRANRIIPVVGDLAGDRTVRELGTVLGEMGLEVTAFYTSNVEFYLWQAGTFERWRGNLSALPVKEDAVVIRSYFPNFGRAHPSAISGYYATQALQPVSVLLGPPFASYWDVVTRGALELR